MTRTTREKIEQLRELKKRLIKGGGEERIEKQHQDGKLTARERVGLLFDPDTFQELFSLPNTGARCLAWAGKSFLPMAW
ncbi:MAG: hypothetical protein HC884_03200 [Chloroflexaceae bacterium]|nr:hypothetical protein [Chloroflexaceae bacterium]